MGFEPTRAEHIGLAVQRLNHSATSSHSSKKALYWCVIAPWDCWPVKRDSLAGNRTRDPWVKARYPNH